MGVKHNFVSGKSDSADTSLVNPSDWNEDHVIDGNVSPDTDNAYSLGISGTSFSDLFLGDAGVINWGAGGVTINHNSTQDSLQIRADDSNLNASTSIQFWVDGTSQCYVSNSALRPSTNDGHTLGTSSAGWSDLYLADGGLIDWGNNGAEFYHSAATDSLIIIADPNAVSANTTLDLGTDGSSRVRVTSTEFHSVTNDQIALGTSSLGWKELYLADAAQIIWNNGTQAIVPIAASGDINIRADTGNTLSNTTIDFEVDGTEILRISNASVSPATNDVAALGTSTLGWSDLYLNNDGVISWSGSTSTMYGTDTDTYSTTDCIVMDFGATSYPNLILANSFTGTGGAEIAGFHDSASPAAFDNLMYMNANGRDSAANVEGYGYTGYRILDPTSGSEDSEFRVATRVNGSTMESIRTHQADPLGNASNATDFNFGNDYYPGLVLEGTGTSTGGPGIYTHHNKATPAVGDYIAFTTNIAEDSAGNAQIAAQTLVHTDDETSTSEDYTYIIRAWGPAIGTTTKFYLSGGGTSTLAEGRGMFHPDGGSYEAFFLYDDEANTGGTNLSFAKNNANTGYPGIYFSQQNSTGDLHAMCDCYFNPSDTTAGSEDAYWVFRSYVAGANTDAIHLNGGGIDFNGVTGGAKGAGTINAKAVYDDNTLLTCYVDDAVQTGQVDMARWDESVRGDEDDPFDETLNKKHTPARRFAARLGTPHDPTKLAGQKLHLQEKRHLTPYPNPDNWAQEDRPSVGEWVQCGVEMDELLFQYIIELEQRIETLEAS